MKHKRFAAMVLAAALLLTGCGDAKSAGSKQPAALAATPAEPEAPLPAPG